jgi:hypothetical protein
MTQSRHPPVPGRVKRAACAALALLALAACSDDASRDTAGGGSAATSASSSQGDRDLQTLQDYRLSMDKLDRWNAAMKNIAIATKGDSSLGDKLASDGTASIDQEVARIEAQPALKRAITDAGLSVREFELVTWTSLQAGMAQAAIDAGANRDSVLENTKVHPDNLAFMKEHGAELTRKRQQMEQEMKALGVDRSE